MFKGNKEIKNFDTEMEHHTVVWERYHMHLPVKEPENKDER